jgi:hypothetical protein
MSVHFDFVVSDVDAENILNCMSAAITKCDEEILEMWGDKTKESYVKWFKAHKEYLLGLTMKMKNTRVT